VHTACRRLARRAGFEVLVDQASTTTTKKLASICTITRASRAPGATGSEVGIVVGGPKGDVYRAAANEAFKKYIGTIAPEAMSEASRKFVLDDLRGIPLQAGRANGGNYFIPSSQFETLAKFKGLLEACGCRLYEIPAACSNDLLAALFESLKAEASTAIATMEEELDRALEGELGAVACHGRAAELEKTLARFQGFGSILGGGLAAIQESIEGLTEQFGAAAMAAEAADEAEKLKEAAQ